MLAPNSQPSSSLLQTLRSSQAQIGSRYASVSEQFGPNYPEARQLKAQLAEATREVDKEQSRIVEQAKMYVRRCAAKSSYDLEGSRPPERRGLSKRNDIVQFQVLLHDFQASRALYEGLVQRLREAGVLSGIEPGMSTWLTCPPFPLRRLDLAPFRSC